MVSITVISVGKIKEKFFTSAIEEYAKRLTRYCNLNIVEVKDEATEGNKAVVLEIEATRIEEKIPENAKVITLCVEGKQKSSEHFSKYLDNLMVTGTAKIVFIIGGSMGLHERIKERSDLRLSFSEMTFPHQLMRVVLLEQIYRAFTIIEGKTYHK